jgi:hypothetical protein
MPYNTRRKSLSLPSLGIHVPVTNAARAAAAAANRASSSSTSSSSSSTPLSNDASPSESPSPSSLCSQAKRLKRSHNDDSNTSPSKSPPATRIKYEHTPPPSPKASPPPHSRPASSDQPRPRAPKKEGSDPTINDVIVEAVVAQLEATGNRPHLVKELAAVLAQRLAIVQHSANPCAIISSRLASFLKRTCWTESLPCPVAKELEAVHPRRTYYFLTRIPRQPFPTQPLLFSFSKPATATPSISGDDESPSSFDIDLDDDHDILDVIIDDTEIRADAVARREMSPSPEVDLSSPELDDIDEDVDSDLMAMGASRASMQIDRERRARGASPPLERDEREFTQTANGLQKKKIVQEHAVASIEDPTEPVLSLDDAGKYDSLFYEYRSGSSGFPSMAMVVSPTMKGSPFVMGSVGGSGLVKRDTDENWIKIDRLLDWDRTPETMELEELDGLLDAYDAY